MSPRGISRPPSRLYDYNRRESANYYKVGLNSKLKPIQDGILLSQRL